MRLFRGPKRREVTAPRAVGTPSARRDDETTQDFAIVTALPAMVMEDDVKEMKKGKQRTFISMVYLQLRST